MQIGLKAPLGCIPRPSGATHWASVWTVLQPCPCDMSINALTSVSPVLVRQPYRGEPRNRSSTPYTNTNGNRGSRSAIAKLNVFFGSAASCRQGHYPSDDAGVRQTGGLPRQLRDEREQAVLDPVPFAGAGRQMANDDRHAGVRQPASAVPASTTARASRCCRHRRGNQTGCWRWDNASSHELPPAADGVGSEGCHIMIDADLTQPASSAMS